jgi:uncharacterized protein with GYD domain
MPQFVVLAKGTMEGKKSIKELKQKFVDVSNLFKAKEARILNAYAMMGQYDYLFITDAPDLETAFELSAMIGALGSFACETCPVMPLEDLYKLI